jgi:hypothetical protein
MSEELKDNQELPTQEEQTQEEKMSKEEMIQRTKEEVEENEKENFMNVMMFCAGKPQHVELLTAFINAFRAGVNGIHAKEGDISFCFQLASMLSTRKISKTKRDITLALVMSSGEEGIQSIEIDRGECSLVSRGGKFRDAFTPENDGDNLVEEKAGEVENEGN